MRVTGHWGGCGCGGGGAYILKGIIISNCGKFEFGLSQFGQYCIISFDKPYEMSSLIKKSVKARQNMPIHKA